MKTNYIISRFKRNGYTISRCKDKIIVKKAFGFAKVFNSYNGAYNYYF